MGRFQGRDAFGDDAVGPIAPQHSQRPLDVLLAFNLGHIRRDLGVP